MAYKISKSHSTPSAPPNYARDRDEASNAPSVLDSLTDRLDSSASAFGELHRRLVVLADRLLGPNPPEDGDKATFENRSPAVTHRLEHVACALSDQVSAFDRAIERLERL
jgi:hypothetical protein